MQRSRDPASLFDPGGPASRRDATTKGGEGGVATEMRRLLVLGASGMKQGRNRIFSHPSFLAFQSSRLVIVTDAPLPNSLQGFRRSSSGTAPVNIPVLPLCDSRSGVQVCESVCVRLLQGSWPAFPLVPCMQVWIRWSTGSRRNFLYHRISGSSLVRIQSPRLGVLYTLYEYVDHEIFFALLQQTESCRRQWVSVLAPHRPLCTASGLRVPIIGLSRCLFWATRSAAVTSRGR